MPDERPALPEEALSRWRREVRRAIPGADPDLIEEVAQHVTDRWLRARDEGLDQAAADQCAHQELEAWHDVRGRPGRVAWRPAGFWNGWASDARYAWRSLRVRPFVAGGAILLAAIATTSILAAFVITYGVLWRQLPYPHADRLAVIWQLRAGEQGQISYPDYKDLTGASVFEAAVAMSGGRGSLRVGDSIERVNLLDIEAAGFAMFGATPMLGRLLHDGDAGQASVMISHRLWRTHLSSDPNVIGRVLWLSGRNYTVVGVLPAGFDFELPITSTLKLERHDLWSVMDRGAPFMHRRDVSPYETLVRLNPSTTLSEAQAALDAIGQRLAASQPSTNRDRTFRIVPLDHAIVSGARRPLLLACAAAVLALLIALANLMTLRRGRDFTDADKTHAQHVSVINEALAHTLFGNTDPIGKRIAVGGGDATGDWHEVIGVVADVRHHALDEPPGPRVYDLFAHHWGRTLFVVARSQTPQADLLIPMIRRAVHSLDPEAPVFESATASALIARSAAPRRLAAALAIALAAAGALLALIGVYAASAAAVAERTREIGVRAALGASPGELLQLVLREAAFTALGGAAFGVLGSLAAARLLNAQLFGVRVSDSFIAIPVVAAILFLVAVTAAVPAARRAAQTDPLIAMRVD